MLPRLATILLLSASLFAPSRSFPQYAPGCQAGIPPSTTFYGGTFWAADSMRWEAVRGSVWTFDSGVGSANTQLPGKPAGYHSLMEGWEGIAVTGTDCSNIVSINDLPPPIVMYSCAMHESVLTFCDELGQHELDQDNWAVSPWIELAPADIGKPGRVMAFDGYFENAYSNYIFFEIHVRWMNLSGALSGWHSTGPIHQFGSSPECTVQDGSVVYDLSSVIPQTATEVQIGLGVINLCGLYYDDCTGVSFTSPWFDNIRFGVYPAPILDSDNDGATDSMEDAAPIGGDGNGDGIPDKDERHVVSMENPPGGGQVMTTFALTEKSPPAGGPVFRCMDLVPEEDLPPLPGGFRLFCGDVFDFDVTGIPMGTEPIGVVAKLPPTCPATTWFNYGPEPGNTTPHWYEFTWNGTTGAVFSGSNVLLTFIDQQRGDGGGVGSISCVGGPAIKGYLHPVITGIVDIKSDQGRQVRLRFQASGVDNAVVASPIIGYEVYRGIDAFLKPWTQRRSPSARSMAAEGWDYVMTVPAHAESVYSVVVPTLADSNVSGPRLARFFVRAATVAPSLFYDSPPDSGYSVDNLAPSAPMGPSGFYDAAGTHLSWLPAPEPDVQAYRIYRGVSGGPAAQRESPAGLAPQSEDLIATVTGTNYVDPGPPGDYYKLSAVDINQNEGGFSLLPRGAISGVGDFTWPLTLTAVSNPARGSLRVQFTLPSSGNARLDLIDIGGRVLSSLDVGDSGPGHNEIDLASTRRIASGLYFVRLSKGAESRAIRVVVIN